MDKILNVYLQDFLVGSLVQNIHGRLEFTYQQDYLQLPKPMPLSHSLPLTDTTFNDKACRPFFSGLLPDETIRIRVARNLGVSAQNPFALLYQIGRECAGAVVLCPPENNFIEQSKKYYLSSEKLAEVLNELKKKPLLAGDKRVKLSLAGAQNKIAVYIENKKYYLVKGVPTTHIIKPAIEYYEDSVFNELFCMRLASQVGLNAAQVSAVHVNNSCFLLVERYDRRWVSNNLFRCHQEDFCQALGTVPEIKYENEGGPNIAQCLELIDSTSSQPAVDKLHFLRALIFNFIVANADAHAKNFSFIYTQNVFGESGIKIKLSPLYDILCTGVYPEVDKKMAMKIGKKYRPFDLQLRHWHRLVADTATSRVQLENEMKNMITNIQKAITIVRSNLLAEGSETQIYDEIIKIINARVQQLSSYFKP